MTIKKICAIVFLLAFLAAAAWFAYHFYHTSKQVYEGVLVYQEQLNDESVCYHA